MTTATRILVTSLSISLTAALASRTALAQEVHLEDHTAQQRLSEGIKYFNTGDYADAESAFAAGYYIESNPVFLFLIGQSARKRGDCRKAVATYDEFLATHPAGEIAATAQHGRDDCKAQLAATPATQEESRSWYSSTGADLLMGTGLLAVATGVTLVTLGYHDAGAAPSAGTVGDFQQQNDRAVFEDRLGLAIGGAGVALAVAGIAWGLMGERETAQAQVAVVPLARGLTLTAGGAF